MGQETMHDAENHIDEFIIALYIGTLDKDSNAKISREELAVLVPQKAEQLP